MMFARQKLFDTGVAGILAQTGPAIDEYGKCRYRGPNGTKCAIGQNITDEAYDPEMEGQSPRIMIGAGWPGAMQVANAIGCETERDAEFAREFQMVHDRAALIATPRGFLPGFVANARAFAKKHKLNTWILDRAS